MKKYLLILLFSAQMIAMAQAPGLEWMKLYGQPVNQDRPGNVDTDAEGNVYIGGNVGGVAGPSPKIRLAKYSSTGNLIWTVFYAPDFNFTHLNLKGMHVDANGNTSLLIGTANDDVSPSVASFVLLKYNNSGTLLWSVYETTSSFYLSPVGMAVDNLGYIYVGANIAPFPTNQYDYIVFKYNSLGSKNWGAIYNGPAGGEDKVSDIAVDNSGNCFLTGVAEHFDTRETKVIKITTVKFSSGGYFQWQKNYSNPDFEIHNPQKVKVDAAGNAYVLATIYDAPATNEKKDPVFYLVKYNPSGTVLWSKNIPGAHWYNAAWEVDAPGNCYIANMAWGGDPKDVDISTSKINSNGNLVWNKKYDGGDSTLDVPSDIELDAAGNVYVTGKTSIAQPGTFLNDQEPKVTTLKYTSSGTFVWVANYSGPKTDPYAAGEYIALHGSGSAPVIYVAGITTHKEEIVKDMLLLKFNPVLKGLNSTLETPPSITGYKLNASPNPFNSRTTIRFEVPYDAGVSLKVYDVAGREIKTLFSGPRSAGIYRVVFDALTLPSQQLFYTLKLTGATGEFKETKPLVLMR